MKYHLHIELLNYSEEIINKILNILDGKLIANCKCYKTNNTKQHTLNYTIEISISSNDIKFLEKFQTYSST
jgi:hypothetical protein